MIMEEQIQIKFRLGSISEDSVKISLLQSCNDKLCPESIRFQFKVDVALDLEGETIMVVPHVRYKLNESTILQAEASFKYEVLGLKNNTSFDEDTGEIKQKADIIPTLVSASFSSLRGIIYSATKDSPLEKYPVPLVGIPALIQKIGVSVVK